MPVGQSDPPGSRRAATAINGTELFYRYPEVTVAATNETVTSVPLWPYPEDDDSDVFALALNAIEGNSPVPTTTRNAIGPDEVTLDGVVPLGQLPLLRDAAEGLEAVDLSTWLWDTPAADLRSLDADSHDGWDSQPGLEGDWTDLITYSAQFKDARRSGIAQTPPSIAQPAAGRLPATSLTDRVRTTFRAVEKGTGGRAATVFETYYAYPLVGWNEASEYDKDTVIDPNLHSVTHRKGPAVTEVTIEGRAFLNEIRGLDRLRRLDRDSMRLTCETWAWDSPNVIVKDLEYNSLQRWDVPQTDASFGNETDWTDLAFDQDSTAAGNWRPVIGYTLTVVDNRANIPDQTTTVSEAELVGETGQPTIPASAVLVSDSGVYWPVANEDTTSMTNRFTEAGTIEVVCMPVRGDTSRPAKGDEVWLRAFGQPVAHGIVEEVGTNGRGQITVTAYTSERRLINTTTSARYEQADPATIIADCANLANVPIELDVQPIEDDDALEGVPGQSRRLIEADQRSRGLNLATITTQFEEEPVLNVIDGVAADAGWVYRIGPEGTLAVASPDSKTSDSELTHPWKTQPVAGVLSDSDPYGDAPQFFGVLVKGTTVQWNADGSPAPAAEEPFRAAIINDGRTSLANISNDQLFRPDADERIDNQVKANNVARELFKEVRQRNTEGGEIALKTGAEAARLIPLDNIRVPADTPLGGTNPGGTGGAGEVFEVQSVEHSIGSTTETTVTVNGTVNTEEVPEPFVPDPENIPSDPDQGNPLGG